MSVSNKGGMVSMAKKNEQPNIKKAGLYIRVSSRRQAEEGYSLEAQRKHLEDYCRFNEFEVYRVYKDEGISGKSLNKREGLLELLKDAEAGIINKVICMKLDRISRNTKDLLTMVENFKKWNVEFVCSKDNIDTASAVGRMFLTILSAVAQFESDVAKERTSDAKMELAAEGKFAGNNIPLGYSYDKLTKEFSVVESEAVIVERVFNEYSSGKSMYAIAKGFNQDGLKTKQGKEFMNPTIKKILTNGFYSGRYAYEGIISKGTHEAIISDRLFNKVQEILGNEEAF